MSKQSQTKAQRLQVIPSASGMLVSITLLLLFIQFLFHFHLTNLKQGDLPPTLKMRKVRKRLDKTGDVAQGRALAEHARGPECDSQPLKNKK